MRIAAAIPIVLVLSAFPAYGQPAPGTARQLYRCEVPNFSGATSPESVSVTMTVVSDGLACVIPNWGVPDERRNPATRLELVVAAQHGTAVPLGPSARYIADPGYVGPDAFAYRATLHDDAGVERTVTVRVDVDVRALPFDRTPGVVRVSMLMPAGPIRVGNDIPVPRKIKDVRPALPLDGSLNSPSGTVLLDATIDANGRVSNARVVRSIPALDAAAAEAVKQWEFTPTVIAGRAVPVIMTVAVTFNQREAAPPATRSSAPGTSSVQPSQPSTGSTLEPDIEAGLDYLQRRKYEEALKAFRQANASRGEKCAVCWVGMARAYEALGAAKNVVESCDRALPLTGDDKALLVQAKQLKAVALQDLGQGKDPKRLREAEDELRAALAIDPAAKHLHLYLGLVLLREERDGDGVAELKQELALRPAGPEADRARSLIENPRRARESFAPPFSVVTLDREHVDLESLKNKVVLLDFWGTWCPPCVAAVPSLKELQKKHAGNGLMILSISSDPEESVLRTFIEKNRMPWPQYWDRNHTLQQTFDIKSFPTYVLLDDEGIMQFRTSGGGMRQEAALEDAIKKLLKAAATRRGAVPSGRVGRVTVSVDGI